MSKAIGMFAIGGAGAQILNAALSQGLHPQQELCLLTGAVYVVAAAISFKKVQP